MTDAALVAAAAAGDRDAAGTLLLRYYPECWRFAYRMMGHVQDAEDVVQDTFLRVVRALRTCREPDRFRFWLFRILANACRTALRQRSRRGRRFVTESDGDNDIERFAGQTTPEDSPRSEASELARHVALSAAIQAALSQLEAKQREAFLLKHVEEMEYTEMAAVTGVGVSALKMRVKRACESLRPLLAGPGSGNFAADDDDLQEKAKWAWLAAVVRKAPELPPDVIARVIHTAAQAAGTSVAVWQTARLVLQWALGTGAAIGVAFAGYSLVKSRNPTGDPARADARAPAAGPAAPVLDSARIEASDTDTIPAQPRTPVPPVVAPPAPRAAAKPETTDETPPDLTPPVDDRTYALGNLQAMATMIDADLDRLRDGLGESGLRDFAVLVNDAAQAGLPWVSLFERALEGVATQRPPALVLERVEHRIGSLREAYQALAMSAMHHDVNAGADALEAGASATQIGEVGRASSPGHAAIALHTLAGLIADGVPPSAATQALVQQTTAGASDATLLALHAAVTADIATGVSPLAALRAQVERLGADSATAAPAPDSAEPSPSPAP